MTDRLKQLLHGEADALDVPPPAAHDVLRQGRGMRRRRTVATGAAGLAVTVAVGGTVFALSTGGGRGGDSAPDPASSPAVTGAVFAAGDQVFFDDGTRSVTITDKAVKSMYYTSVGVLVRQGDNSYSDGGGKQRFSLLRGDGTLTPVSVETEETVHATDSDQPYLVYGQRVDGRLVVFVHDVAADQRVARVEVGPTKDGWFPVAIDGDTAYVQDGYEGAVFEVDWAAGTVAESDLDSVWDVVDGRTATQVDGRPAVVDVASGDVLLEADGPGSFHLSPDGRYAEFVDEDFGMDGSTTGPVARLEVHDVADGSTVTVESASWGWAWTPDGELFSLADDGTLTTCDPDTGDCAERQVELPPVPRQECGTEVCDAGSLDLILGNTVRES